MKKLLCIFIGVFLLSNLALCVGVAQSETYDIVKGTVVHTGMESQGIHDPETDENYSVFIAEVTIQCHDPERHVSIMLPQDSRVLSLFNLAYIKDVEVEVKLEYDEEIVRYDEDGHILEREEFSPKIVSVSVGEIGEIWINSSAGNSTKRSIRSTRR